MSQMSNNVTNVKKCHKCQKMSQMSNNVTNVKQGHKCHKCHKSFPN